MKLRIVLLIFVLIGSLVCGSLQVNAAGDDKSAVNNKNYVINLSGELTRAASLGNKQEVKSLIEQGANVNQANNLGNTALVHAAFWGHTDIVDLLIVNNADVNQADKLGGNTALIEAACWGHADIVDLLVANNVDVNQANNYGNTALIEAAFQGPTDIVELLCEKQVNIHLKNDEGKTALDYAQERDDQRMIKAISRHKLSPKNCGMNNKKSN